MDIIRRNFFRLLRSGALNEFESLEPMSTFKWNKLFHMVEAQNIASIVAKGIKNHQYDNSMNLPTNKYDHLPLDESQNQRVEIHPALSNPLLNKRLKKIHKTQVHATDTSIETLHLLDIIVDNVRLMLNQGISIRGIMALGTFLRNRGNKVDFIKLEHWLDKLHVRRMAQLQGSILISIFKFEKDEIPFVNKIEAVAYPMTLRSVNHAILDTTKEWHFKQGRSGFVKNNSAVLRRSFRRSARYIRFAPLETTSNLVFSFVRSLSEIEE
ncbi:MAG: hypothetical protein MSD82_06755 [Prevotella sp.]|nr:hypothetical protein [Prevotella sp.]